MSKTIVEKFKLTKKRRETTGIFVKDGVAYKKLDESGFKKEKERNIDFLMKNPVPNSPLIFKKEYENGELIRYQMEYLAHTITFREALTMDIPIYYKLSAIRDIYEALKFLHKNNIFVGDVHLDNLLISNEGMGYLVDLDEIRFIGDEFKFKQCYLIKPNNNSFKINIPSRYTDNVKFMISSLSLIFNIDLEDFIDNKSHDINLESIYHRIIVPSGIEELIIYFQDLMDQKETIYFDEMTFFTSKIRTKA